MGSGAGQNLTIGDDNIDIGNPGVADESNAIRIGIEGTQTATFIAGVNGVSFAGAAPVVIDANGQLGTGDQVRCKVQPDRLDLLVRLANPVQMELTEPTETSGLDRTRWRDRFDRCDWMLPVRLDRLVRLERWTLVAATRLGVMALYASLTGLGRSTTLHLVSMRSIATHPALVTRPTALRRSYTNNFGIGNTANGYQALYNNRSAALIRPTAIRRSTTTPIGQTTIRQTATQALYNQHQRPEQYSKRLSGALQ